MISLSRNEINNVNEQYIPINSFLKIGSIVYKHHATAVFNGKVAAGHYTSLIKIDGEYFQFNDEIVSALFYYERCSPTLRTFITEINNQMNRRGTLFLYIKCYENYVPNVYEQISFQCPTQTYPGSAPISAMKNTLRQINKSKNKSIKSLLKNAHRQMQKKTIKHSETLIFITIFFTIFISTFFAIFFTTFFTIFISIFSTIFFTTFFTIFISIYFTIIETFFINFF